MVRQIPPSAGTAKTLILVGLIFDAIFTLIFLGVGASAVAASIAFASGATIGFSAVVFVFGIIGILILFLVYTTTYRRVRDGNYEGARLPTLIWAILSLVTLSILPGILYLIAYIKLGDAISESQQPPYGGVYPAAGYPAQPYAQPAYMVPAAAPVAAAPSAPPAAAPGAAPTCPRCGQPATYIAQYGRWYCPRDQTYL